LPVVGPVVTRLFPGTRGGRRVLQVWRKVLFEAISSWNDHDATTQSAALAFYTLFSLAPVLVVVIAVAGAVFGAEAVRGQIFGEFQAWMGPEAAAFVQSVLRSAAKPTGSRLAATLGTLTLVFGASGVFVQLQGSLNRIWGVIPKPGATFTTLLRKRLLSFAVLLGLGFLLVVSLVLSAAIHALGDVIQRHFAFSVHLVQVINLVASFSVVSLLFALIFMLLPDVKLGWRDVALGAVITSLLFGLGKELIGFYLGRTGTASAYGAAGSLVMVLLWIYYSSLIFLFGAELTRIQSRRERGSVPPEEGAMRAAASKDPTTLRAGIGIVLVFVCAGRAGGATSQPPRQTVKVEVEGVSGELRRNVLATLAIEQERKEKDLDEARIRHFHAQAVDQIGHAVEPYGYYKPVVQASLHHQGNEWTARYVIDPGPPLKVTHREIELVGEAMADPAFEAVVSSFPLHEGEVVNQLLYEAGKKSLEDYAAEHGYLDGSFRVNQIRVDVDAYTCDIVLHYDSGQRFHYGPVIFHQDFLRPSVLQGYIKLREGEPIAASELRKLQNDLAASPYFQRVEVVPDRTQAVGDRVPIAVNLTPSKRFRFAGGLGYGTDTGPRANLAVDVRRVNDRGHYITSEGRVSLIERSFKVDYNLPGAYPRTDVFTYRLAYAKVDTNTSTTNSALAGVGQARTVGRWQQALRLDFERATFKVGVDHGTSHLLTPQASWTRVWSNDRIFPTRGLKLELDLGAAERRLLSNASYLQERAAGKWITSLRGQPFRLITRAEAGYTEISDRDFHGLPPIIRFFAGGDQSVRGYGYQQLGPRDISGHVSGGRALATGSVELEYRLLQKWGVATFFDAGNAAQNFSLNLKEGTGVGLRWLSPIGMVRADVAFALSIPGHPIRFHLNIGPDL
jgi:translocation and assembly module TamA